MGVFEKVRHVGELVKFSHTLFALPFALASMVVAAKGWPGTKLFLLILAAMVTARTSAMAFNRWLDAAIDAQNPRTQNRPLPQGRLSRRFTLGLALLSAGLFVWAAFSINPLAFFLSPVALVILWGYSFTKRFTPFSHLLLGLALGLAPAGAWIAVRDNLELTPLLLTLAVLFWVAGFDIIYATQDYEFDRKGGLHSLVVWLGIEKALKISRLFHLITWALFVLFGYETGLGWIYFAVLIGIGLLLLYEHSLVSPRDLSRVNAAFFTANGFISILFLVGLILAM